jgi:hypothetical protein
MKLDIRLVFTVAATIGCIGLDAQAPGGPPGQQPPRTAKAAAFYDITGEWVAVVTEDWRYRMITPKKGDFGGISLNAEGRKLANAWDPGTDETAGEQCKAYGAPGLMRMPGRLRIAWQDDQTLKIESDSGEQVRLLHFDSSEAAGTVWQGVSKASWERVPVGFGVPPLGSLKVVTTRMKPGYLRRNGVPYSAGTTLTEYLDRVNEPGGTSYLLVSMTVEDPAYLAQPFLTSAHYRKAADSSGWKPTPCTAK